MWNHTNLIKLKDLSRAILICQGAPAPYNQPTKFLSPLEMYLQQKSLSSIFIFNLLSYNLPIYRNGDQPTNKKITIFTEHPQAPSTSISGVVFGLQHQVLL